MKQTTALIIYLLQFLIFDYKYLFIYYIFLVQSKNIDIYGAKISWVFIFLGLFTTISIPSLHDALPISIIKQTTPLIIYFLHFLFFYFLTINTSSHIIFSQYRVRISTFSVWKFRVFFLISLFLGLFTSISIPLYILMLYYVIIKQSAELIIYLLHFLVF